MGQGQANNVHHGGKEAGGTNVLHQLLVSRGFTRMQSKCFISLALLNQLICCGYDFGRRVTAEANTMVFTATGYERLSTLNFL